MSGKGRKRQKKINVEDIYRNNNFVPPKEQNLETIFEEPRLSKDGGQILTSVKKYKRYLHFDDTQNKIQKRKRNAKKCVKKFKSTYQITRSSPKDLECDYSYHILGILEASLSDSDEEDSDNTHNTSTDTPVVKTRRQCVTKRTSSDLLSEASHSDMLDTPKRKRYRSNSRKQSTSSQEIDVSKSEITALDSTTDNASRNCITDNISMNGVTGNTSANDETCDTSINDKTCSTNEKPNITNDKTCSTNEKPNTTNDKTCSTNDEKPNTTNDITCYASTSYATNSDMQVSDMKEEDDIQSPRKSCIIS